ncbi:ATP-binding cassette domain-containing protein [Bacteroides sp. 519]|uniref:ATP-binding cassette domain-containing protein n=1 Tax=Bacteroides sp. 519 TaxID=2302937 RepID=UPI0013CF5035|nr:ATP-binding cassette domain-containing protein [Bacteroides sp. 519]NDV58605.1 ATP-binding cassette domain-containing protein [Bacteroides sp. 519]
MQHSLELDSVLKTFGSFQLLTDVYLRINTNDVIGLFGRNGTGKTVLLNILFGTMKADRKFIRLNEAKVLDKTFKKESLISYLPQHHFLPKHLNIEKITSVFLSKEKKEAFFHNDDIANINRKRQFIELSSGERKYLEIKLLLFKESKFLLLDEPFNFLSPLIIKQVTELIKEHAANKGIIIADHNYKHVLNVANRIMIIKEGVLKELTDKQGLVEQGYLKEYI